LYDNDSWVLLCASKLFLLAGPVVALPAAVASAAGWQQLLHTVVLEGRGLRSLAGLATASRLVVASFADNLLTGLQGLQGCGQLLELNISNNLVTEVCKRMQMHCINSMCLQMLFCSITRAWFDVVCYVTWVAVRNSY
jgi:hypothetical protein